MFISEDFYYIRLAQVCKLVISIYKCTFLHSGRKGKKMSYLNSVTEFRLAQVCKSVISIYKCTFLHFGRKGKKLKVGGLFIISTLTAEANAVINK